MNSKRIWFMIPAVIFPYLILASLAIIFFSTTNPIATYIMVNLLNSNALNLLFIVLIYAVIALMLSIICFALSIYKNWNSLSLAKTVKIIKLIQIPAYVTIFALGLIFLLAIFTAPFTFLLFVFDCVTLMMTGLLCTSAVIIATRQNLIEFKNYFWVIILQFFFCCDVVASIIFYFKLKKISVFSESLTLK